jgi:hypothetical protein
MCDGSRLLDDSKLAKKAASLRGRKNAKAQKILAQAARVIKAASRGHGCATFVRV